MLNLGAEIHKVNTYPVAVRSHPQPGSPAVPGNRGWSHGGGLVGGASADRHARPVRPGGFAELLHGDAGEGDVRAGARGRGAAEAQQRGQLPEVLTRAAAV